MWKKAGKIYDKVFPEPVLAIPITSCPSSAMGQPIAWIGVGFSNPSLFNCLVVVLGKFASAKVMKGLGGSQF